MQAAAFVAVFFVKKPVTIRPKKYIFIINFKSHSMTDRSRPVPTFERINLQKILQKCKRSEFSVADN